MEANQDKRDFCVGRGCRATGMSNKGKMKQNNKYQDLIMNMLVMKGIVVEMYSTCKGLKGIRTGRRASWC